MQSERPLLMTLSALVPGNVPGRIEAASAAQGEAERWLSEEFFRGAPFRQVGLLIRYGKKTDLRPRYERIYRNKELPVTVEVAMEAMARAAKSGPDELRLLFLEIIAETLLQVAQRHGLPTERLQVERARLPNTLVPQRTLFDVPAESSGDNAEELEPDLAIHYRIDGFGGEADLERRHAIEDHLDRQLRLNRAGRCTGGDIGSGTMSIFCRVSDLEEAIEIIMRALGERGNLKGATIVSAPDGDDMVVYYPRE